jgi:hypothetical protein
MIIKPPNFVKRQCKLQWLTPPHGMLKTWIDSVRQAGVTNFLVVAIDEDVAGTMKKMGVPCWYREPRAMADNSQDNHGISSQK